MKTRSQPRSTEKLCLGVYFLLELRILLTNSFYLFCLLVCLLFFFVVVVVFYSHTQYRGSLKYHEVLGITHEKYTTTVLRHSIHYYVYGTFMYYLDKEKFWLIFEFFAVYGIKHFYNVPRFYSLSISSDDNLFPGLDIPFPSYFHFFTMRCNTTGKAVWIFMNFTFSRSYKNR